MHMAKLVFVVVASLAVAPLAAGAAPLREEHVTGGVLDLVWAPGYGLSNNMRAQTLGPIDPGYNNPSGDHTVANATTSAAPDSGGLILTATEPAGLADYQWEAYIFTGNGDTRRGLVVRANPDNGFTTSYTFVLQAGMLQLAFRKLSGQTGTALGSWPTNTLPGGTPLPNTWHHMKVIAVGNVFRCYWDGFELTAATPVVDVNAPYLSGWVGVYNFRFDVGGIPFLTDDLLLSRPDEVPTVRASWGAIKAGARMP